MFYKNPKAISQAQDHPFNKWCEDNWDVSKAKQNLNCDLKLYTKNYLQMDQKPA